MRFVVCVKQVSQLGDEVEFTGDGCDVDPDYLASALNEWDGFAAPAALQLRAGLRGGAAGGAPPGVRTNKPGINQPRYANLRAIKQAEQVEIDVRTAAGGAEAYRVRRMFVPSKGEGAQLLKGRPAAIAGQLLELVG